MVPLSLLRGTWELVIKGDGEMDLYRCRSLRTSMQQRHCVMVHLISSCDAFLPGASWLRGRGKELHTTVSFLSAWVDGMEACHSDAPVGSAWVNHVEACYSDVFMGSPLQLLSPLGSGIAILSRMWQKWDCSGWNFNDNLATFAFAFLNHEL